MEGLQSHATYKAALRSDKFGSWVAQRCVSSFWRVVAYVALTLMAGAAFAQDIKDTIPQTTLTVIDPSQSDTIAIPATSDDFHQRLLVQIDALKAGAALQIESPPLLGPDGVEAELVIIALGQKGKSIKVEPSATDNGTVNIDLSATLKRIGEYTGYIMLRYGDEKPTVKPIHINRTLVDLPIEMSGIERVSNQNCWTCWREATVWLTLQAQPDRQLTVMPTLTELALNRTGQEQLQAIYSGHSIFAGNADVAKGITLASGETKRVAVNISGLGEPGEYVGKIRFTSAGFKPKDQAFIMLIKDGWLFAVIPIVFGALASMWLRRYGSDQRPRLIVRQRIAKLGEQIDALRSAVGTLDETENRVLDALNLRLIALYGEATGPEPLADGWIAATQSALQSIAAKLPSFTLWANARRAIAAIEPSDKVTVIQTKIFAIQTALAGDADLTDDQKDGLVQLPTEIAGLRRLAVLDVVNALQGEFDQLRDSVLPAQLVAPGWAEANGKLAQAKRHADAGEFDAARSAHEEARKIFANLLLDDFATRIVAGTPVGLKAEQWSELKPQIERHLEQARAAADAKGALAGYAQAYGLYLNGQITALLPRLLDKEMLDAKAQKLAADKQQGFLDLAKEAAADLREASALLTRGELREAYDKHIGALSDWQDLNGLLPAGDRMGATATASGTGEIAPGFGLPPDAGHTVLMPTVFGRVAENATELSERTKTMDNMVDVLAIALSAVLGVLYVWGPNPTWGGLSDYLTALLWGLGLHQVSGFTFDGVLGLREKLL